MPGHLVKWRLAFGIPDSNASPSPDLFLHETHAHRLLLPRGVVLSRGGLPLPQQNRAFSNPSRHVRH